MKKPLALKIIKAFKPILCKLGVEYDKLERILALKLLMDSRKASVLDKNKSEGKAKFRYEYFINLFLGFMLATILCSDMLPLFYGETVILGTVMLYTFFYILADYSTVILDLRDKTIIGSTPIKEVTLNMAKMLHIIIYLSQITLSLMIFPLLGTLFFKGILSFIILVVEMLMVVIFSLSLTTSIYYVLISKCSGEKLKDFINYVQVVFMVLTILMQQILPRVFSFTDGKEITYIFKWWYFLLPPFWMGAPFELLSHGITHNGYIGLTVCGILIPIGLFLLYIKKMAPYFESKLTKMNSGEKRKERKKSTLSLGERIGKIICRQREEYHFYCFTNQMIRSERKFKLQVYPSLAMGVIFPFVFALMAIELDDPTSWITQVQESKVFFFIYFTSMCAGQCLMAGMRSENSKAAWLYQMIPVSSEMIIHKGYFKAIAVKYLLPLIVYQSVFLLVIWKAAVIPYMLVININAFVVFIIYYRALGSGLPFSKAYQSDGENNTGAAMGTALIIMMIGFMHWGISSASAYGNMIMGIIGIIASVYLYVSSFNEKKALRKAEI